MSLDELDGDVDDEALVSLLDDDAISVDDVDEFDDEADMPGDDFEYVLVEGDVGVVAADWSLGARLQPATSVVPARIAASSVMR